VGRIAALPELTSPRTPWALSAGLAGLARQPACWLSASMRREACSVAQRPLGAALPPMLVCASRCPFALAGSGARRPRRLALLQSAASLLR